MANVDDPEDILFTCPRYKKLLTGEETPVNMKDKEHLREDGFRPTAKIDDDGGVIHLSNNDKYDLNRDNNNDNQFKVVKDGDVYQSEFNDTKYVAKYDNNI